MPSFLLYFSSSFKTLHIGFICLSCYMLPAPPLSQIFPAIKAKVQRFWKLWESRGAEEREAEETGVGVRTQHVECITGRD